MWIPALQKVPYSCTKFTETNTFNKLKSALSGESPSEHTLLEQGTGGAVQTWAAQHTGRQRERHCMAGRSFSITTLRPAIASVQRGRLLNKGATGRFSSHHCDWNPDTDNLIEQRLLGLTILKGLLLHGGWKGSNSGGLFTWYRGGDRKQELDPEELRYVRPTPLWSLLLTARPCLIRVPQSPRALKASPPLGDQDFKHTNLGMDAGTWRWAVGGGRWAVGGGRWQPGLFAAQP